MNRAKKDVRRNYRTVDEMIDRLVDAFALDFEGNGENGENEGKERVRRRSLSMSHLQDRVDAGPPRRQTGMPAARQPEYGGNEGGGGRDHRRVVPIGIPEGGLNARNVPELSKTLLERQNGSQTRRTRRGSRTGRERDLELSGV